MNLHDWRKDNNILNVRLATLIGVHPSYITHFHKGRRKFSSELALKIEQATGGQVSRMELLYPDQDEAT